MIQLPYEVLFEKIIENSDLTKDELEKQVTDKLESLAGLISKEGALHIIANDLGITLSQSMVQLKVEHMQPGMRNATLSVKVLEPYETKSFQGERSGKLKPVLVGDESGIIRAVFWNEQADAVEKIKRDDILLLENLYVKQGYQTERSEIHISDRSTITINPDGVSIHIPERSAKRKKMEDITQDDDLIEAFGTIVQIYDPYFFEACDECTRKLKNKDGVWTCDTHGEKEPSYRGILNLYVDDGSRAMRSVFFHDQFKQITKIPLETIRTDGTEALKQELLGSFITLQARVRYSQQYDKLDLNVTSFTLNPDPQEELKRLEAEEPAKE